MFKTQKAETRRIFDWQPNPILMEAKEATLLMLDAQREKAKRLNLSLRAYYKILARFLESAGMQQEAWICEMFCQKNFNRLFSKHPIPESKRQWRSRDDKLSREVDHLWDSMGRILLVADVLELLREFSKPNAAAKHKSKLSPAEIELAKIRFRELAQQQKSANFAYKYIAKELSQGGRQISRATVRRACDEKFAEQSGCTYGKKSMKNKRRRGFALLHLDNLEKAMKHINQRSATP